jgi:hypothetical protein
MKWKRILLFGGLSLGVTLTVAVVAAVSWLIWLFWPNTRVFVAGNVRLEYRLDEQPQGFSFALIGERSDLFDPAVGLSVRAGASRIDFDESFSEQRLPSGEPSRAYDLDPSVTGWPPGARRLFLFDGAVEAVVAEGSVRQVCIRSDLSPQGLEVRTALSGEWIRFPVQEAEAAKLFGTPLYVFNTFRY